MPQAWRHKNNFKEGKKAFMTGKGFWLKIT